MNNQEEINKLIKESKVDTNLISDGYHTFGELYEHRITLFIVLCNFIQNTPPTGCVIEDMPWKSKKHHDGTFWDGWFIAGIGTDKGKQISYHLPIDKWDLLNVPSYETAPAEFDGHTPADVIKRLLELI